MRPRREIEVEILVLRILRGDFGDMLPGGDPLERVRAAIVVAGAGR